MPAGYKLDVIRDNTETTRTSVDAVKEHLVLGAILASLVVLLFLGNVRSTIIAALAIPTSIIGTFLLMWLMGFTLNTITLLALALAVGIVIDDAIVVLENIFRFIDEKKIRPMPAAIYATKEIGLAVLATTLSLLAVFLPVAFMNSIPGRFLRSFGLTMGAAIAISLFVSFTLTPMLSSRWLRLDTRPAERAAQVDPRAAGRLVLPPIERFYMKVLAFVMRHRWIVVLAAVGADRLDRPAGQGGPQGLSCPRTTRRSSRSACARRRGPAWRRPQLAAERIAREVRAWPEVSTTLVTIGDNSQKTPNLASIFVRLLPPDKRKVSQDQLQDRVRDEIVPKQPKEYRISASAVAAFGAGTFSTATVQYILTGPDLDRRHQLLGDDRRQAEGDPRRGRRRHHAGDRQPRAGGHVNRRKAADLGVNVADVATASQLLIGGVKVSRYEEAGREYDILVRADEAFRNSPDALSQLTVPSSRLGAVPLLDVVELKRAEGPSKIDRYARQRQVTFLANTSPGVGSGEVGRGARKGGQGDEPAVAVPLRAVRSVEGDRPHRQGLHPRLRDVVHLHVPHPGGAVRVVAAPDHHPAGAAADGAVRADLAARCWVSRSTSSPCSASWCCSAW